MLLLKTMEQGDITEYIFLDSQVIKEFLMSENRNETYAISFLTIHDLCRRVTVHLYYAISLSAEIIFINYR